MCMRQTGGYRTVMGMEATILSLHLGKTALNLIPLLCRPGVQSRAVETSLLILIITDIGITGFLLSLWFTGWPLSLGLDKVSLRFLCFQNETYRCVALLLPLLCISEEWCRSCLLRYRRSEKLLNMQASLLSLACWMVAAFYGSYLFGGCMQATACNSWDWNCIFTYLHQTDMYYLMLPCISAVFGFTLLSNSLALWDYNLNTIWYRDKSPQSLMMCFLLCVGTAAIFLLFPPFLAVSSWSALALDIICGIFRALRSEPLISIHIEEDHRYYIHGQTAIHTVTKEEDGRRMNEETGEQHEQGH
ncbi:uncharacterized protein O3C94_000321 [Discoglossus pictus]